MTGTSSPASDLGAPPVGSDLPRVLLACGVFIALVFVLPLGVLTLLDSLFPTAPGATLSQALGQAFGLLALTLLIAVVMAVLVARWAKRFAGLRLWWGPLSVVAALAIGYVLSDFSPTNLPAFAAPLLVVPLAMRQPTRGRDRGIVLITAFTAMAILLGVGVATARRDHDARVRNLEAHGVPLMAPTGMPGTARSISTLENGTVAYTWAETDRELFDVRLSRTPQPDAGPSQVNDLTVRCVRQGVQIEVQQAEEPIDKLAGLCRAMRPVSADWMIRSEERA